MLKKSLFVALFVASFSIPAYAYFDPGTGSFLVQGLIVLFTTVFFYLLHPLQFIKNILKKLIDRLKHLKKTKIE